MQRQHHVVHRIDSAAKTEIGALEHLIVFLAGVVNKLLQLHPLKHPAIGFLKERSQAIDLSKRGQQAGPVGKGKIRHLLARTLLLVARDRPSRFPGLDRPVKATVFLIVLAEVGFQRRSPRGLGVGGNILFQSGQICLNPAFLDVLDHGPQGLAFGWSGRNGPHPLERLIEHRGAADFGVQILVVLRGGKPPG